MGCGGGCGFDLGRGPQRLMRTGITLIVLGHVNFILGAIVHGTVLRHVANPERTVTSEYTTANVISVGSGLLSITAGIVAILVSRNLLKSALDTALALWFPSMVMAAVEALLSGRCCVVALTLRGIGPCAHAYSRQQQEKEMAMKEVAPEDRPMQELRQLLPVERGVCT
ncbi:keratinocyte-associated protein 3 isoform X3 [Carettochelys insculpta]|uniref:keratinocyte-associated protein 3 isoform X3 n=1 Tax=Carettochelys insculpta TaxID=44489 RepID=UPI003EB9C009